MSEEPARFAQEIDSTDLEHSLFDHDVEEPASPARRRRPVADWGGDDLFNHVPRRRFARPPVSAHLRRSGATAVTSHQLRRNAEAPGLPLRHADHRGFDSDFVTTLTATSHVQPPFVMVYDPLDDGVSAPDRPGATRRRPPRTVDERLGPRPDRIAAWAFALGLLLILMAVGTADAAVLPGF